MWRRVSCEQPLNTSQSFLRLSGNIVQWSGDLNFVLEPRPHSRKGIRSLFLNLVA